MLKYLTKIAMDILPSVAATIIGAWVVNHYIVARPAVEAPTAAAVAPASPRKADAKLANIPEPGVKAKGISERAMLEQTAAERPAMAEKPVERPQEKSAEKPADQPVETASIPADTRRHPPVLREKAVAKVAPVQVVPATPAVAPVVASPATAPSAEAATVPDDRRDANDLARAAIERLRGTGEASPRPQEAARIPDTPRVASAPVVSAPQVRPLPPPIMVSTPTAGTYSARPGTPAPTNPVTAATDDPNRPTPPADIPEAAPPLDLRAEAVVVDPPPRREHTNVAEDMLLAAKSVFHAVLPK